LGAAVVWSIGAESDVEDDEDAEDDEAFFGSFAVTDDISSLKWYGEDGFVKFAGLMALTAVVLSCLGLVLFDVWRRQRSRVPTAAAAKELDAQEQAWKQNRLLEIERLDVTASSAKDTATPGEAPGGVSFDIGGCAAAQSKDVAAPDEVLFATLPLATHSPAWAKQRHASPDAAGRRRGAEQQTPGSSRRSQFASPVAPWSSPRSRNQRHWDIAHAQAAAAADQAAVQGRWAFGILDLGGLFTCFPTDVSKS